MEHKRKRPDDGGWMEGRKGSCFHFTTIALSRELKEYRRWSKEAFVSPKCVCVCLTSGGSSCSAAGSDAIIVIILYSTHSLEKCLLLLV